MCSFLFTNRDASDFHYVNEYMEKRGPDKTTITEVGDHTFVHNILSITGEFRPQPFVNEERQIVCVYNGEIYNAGNYSSDGESIIPRYLQYGFYFPKHIDGEFAICLVDYANRKIVVTTDTFSTKPVWIAIEDGDIGVASYESSLLRRQRNQQINATTNNNDPQKQTHAVNSSASFIFAILASPFSPVLIGVFFLLPPY